MHIFISSQIILLNETLTGKPQNDQRHMHNWKETQNEAYHFKRLMKSP